MQHLQSPLYAQATSSSSSPIVNFDLLPQAPPSNSDTITVRRAPGQRGPAPTACERCRRLRGKCERRNGGRIGEEACLACVKKGVECKIPKEITRRQALPSRREQAIFSTELSSSAVASLFDLYYDASKAGVESNLLPILFHDSRSIQYRYNLAGRNIDRLDPSDQLRTRLMWAASLKRWTFEGSAFDGKAVSATMLEQAQKLADSKSAWRIPTIPNFKNLLLLFALTSNGNLQNEEARFYLAAASTQFSQLFPSNTSLSNPVSSKKGWAAYTLVIVDTARALESCSPPQLSDQDFAKFLPDTNPYQLPSPSFLLSFLPHSPLELIDQFTRSMTYYLQTARRLAHQFALPPTSVDDHQIVQTFQAAFLSMDLYEEWDIDSLNLFRAQELPSVVRVTIQSALTLNWILCLMLEFTTRDYLRRRVARSRGQNETDSTPLTATNLFLAPLVNIAEERCQRSLCTFLRQTRNREGIYLLAASTGFLGSVDRLAALATTLSATSTDNHILYPIGAVDKLASLTFLLQSLRSAQVVYDSPVLAQSISLLEETQAVLQIECGYSGDMALILILSFASTASNAAVETHIPDVPSVALIEAVVLMAGGN